MSQDKDIRLKLSEFIPAHFVEAFRLLINRMVTHLWLKGGRGSIKSSIAAIFIVIYIMLFPDAHAVCLKRHKTELHDSVYARIKWAIRKLRVENRFRISDATQGAPAIVYRPTGQKIMFAGMDDAEKIKSINVEFGMIAITWYEEVHQLDGMESIRKANQSIRRGGISESMMQKILDKFKMTLDEFFSQDDEKIDKMLGNSFATIYTYNPPREAHNWVNEEADKLLVDIKKGIIKGWYIHHSTWDMLSRLQQYTWLGKEFIQDAMELKERDPEAYRHEYDGIPVGYGTTVFKNLHIREISDHDISIFDNVAAGIDFGYSADAAAFPVSHYDKKYRRLYIFRELYLWSNTNLQFANEIKQLLPIKELRIPKYADSAEPKSIKELEDFGVRNVRPARKGPDSVEGGIRFLQGLDEIVVDPVRCPHTAREFKLLAFKVDKNGRVVRDIDPKLDDHALAATRYRMEEYFMDKWNWDDRPDKDTNQIPTPGVRKSRVRKR